MPYGMTEKKEEQLEKPFFKNGKHPSEKQMKAKSKVLDKKMKCKECGKRMCECE